MTYYSLRMYMYISMHLVNVSASLLQWEDLVCVLRKSIPYGKFY